MKKYLLVILLSLLVTSIYAQKKRPTKDQENLMNDLLGVFKGDTDNKENKEPKGNKDNKSVDLKEEKITTGTPPKESIIDPPKLDKSKQAYLSSDSNENKVYRDNKGNEVTYSKEMWNKMLNYFKGEESVTLDWLIKTYGRKSNVREVHKLNVEGQLEFSNKDKFKVTFGKNKLGVLVYSDSNGNKITYSKEFADEILGDNQGNEVNIFIWLVDRFQPLKGYNESYEVDQSLSLKYSNNQSSSAFLKYNLDNIIIYEDSRGNNLEFDTDTWQRMLGKIGSDKKVFLSLISKYLFNYIPL